MRRALIAVREAGHGIVRDEILRFCGDRGEKFFASDFSLFAERKRDALRTKERHFAGGGASICRSEERHFAGGVTSLCRAEERRFADG